MSKHYANFGTLSYCAAILCISGAAPVRMLQVTSCARNAWLLVTPDYRVTATAPEYDLLLAIRQRRLRYLGHILRMPESRVVRRALVALAKGGSVYPKGSLFMDCQTMKFHQLVALAQRHGAWNALATQLR